MGFWNKIVGELVDIIEWTDTSNNTLVWRFERYQNEIKNGAQLTVRPGQVAIFVNEGQIADIFDPGMYTLATSNLPILATLKGWKHGFNSPFKAEVYFINTRLYTDNKWGTTNPIMMRDQEFGMVRIRAFGSFDIQVSDPRKLLEQVVGTSGYFRIDDIHNQLRSLAVSRFSDAVAESNIPVLDLAANYNEFSSFMKEKMVDDFDSYGLTLSKFVVENISLPKDVEAVLDKRTSMGILGDLNQYTQYQTANAIETAAEKGGNASAGLEMGMGFAMAQNMANAMNPQSNTSSPSPHSAPPPLPTQTLYYIAVNGQQTGPFGIEQIKAQISSNTLTQETLVWAEGMPNWQKANEVSALKVLFSVAPPPIPGA
ncbi:SPFH domain-containing protein [Thaumasiovibrio subtropicus]|uniref:SPFH domain-containing protein n=1 Tax=Thaumasiovibrio subtropicus TaxID=1891207 RepID=UPI000B34DFD5|nr:SPFH domain-containing protein [Thaumasiovibrio subtropicus]